MTTMTLRTALSPWKMRPWKLSKDHKKILKYIQQWNMAGATCDEVVYSLHMPHQTVSARFTELKRWGFIAYSGRSRLTKRGRPAKVYVTTEV